ncbi:MAG: hypothetical protein J6J03_07260 [Tyzzerella sp.]|nr:hypothetical protein [Tyzzerella sp.]
MKTEQMIEELHKIANKHKNDIVGVGELNLHAMCIDVAKRLQELLEKSGMSEWIPIKWHETTDDDSLDKERYPLCLDCEMPEDGQEIVVCRKNGYVCADTCIYDDGYYLDSDCDWIDDVIAWMPLPEPYNPYNPNTCKNTECPFYCPKQDCVAKEGCDGYIDE